MSNRYVVVRNLLWPGATFVQDMNTGLHGFFYNGDGVKNLDLPFMIWRWILNDRVYTNSLARKFSSEFENLTNQVSNVFARKKCFTVGFLDFFFLQKRGLKILR